MKIMINRTVLGLFFIFAFIAACCTASWAADIMRYEPRTPAGGRAVGDPDFFWRQAQAVEYGPGSIFSAPSTVAFESGLGKYLVKTGYYEIDEAGNLLYFDESGNEVNPEEYVVTSDPQNGPFGVNYFAPEKSTQRRLGE